MQRNQTRQNRNDEASTQLRSGEIGSSSGYKPGGYDRGTDPDRGKVDQGSNKIDGSRGSDQRMQSGKVDDQGEQFYRDMGNHGLDTSASSRYVNQDRENNLDRDRQLSARDEQFGSRRRGDDRGSQGRDDDAREGRSLSRDSSTRLSEEWRGTKR